MIQLQAYKTHTSAVGIRRATAQSACWDVSACLVDGARVQIQNAWNELSSRVVTHQQLTLFGGERALVPTGWIFDIPQGYSMRLHPRSGLAWKQGVSLANAQGVIDADYVQETFVLLINQTEVQHVISHGDRIAQLEILPVCDFEFTEVAQAPVLKTNRQGGFGSTGVSL